MNETGEGGIGKYAAIITPIETGDSEIPEVNLSPVFGGVAEKLQDEGRVELELNCEQFGQLIGDAVNAQIEASFSKDENERVITSLVSKPFDEYEVTIEQRAESDTRDTNVSALHVFNSHLGIWAAPHYDDKNLDEIENALIGDGLAKALAEQIREQAGLGEKTRVDMQIGDDGELNIVLGSKGVEFKKKRVEPALAKAEQAIVDTTRKVAGKIDEEAERAKEVWRDDVTPILERAKQKAVDTAWKVAGGIDKKTEEASEKWQEYREERRKERERTIHVEQDRQRETLTKTYRESLHKEGGIPAVSDLFLEASELVENLDEPGNLNALIATMNALGIAAGEEGYKPDINVEGEADSQALIKARVRQDFSFVEDKLVNHFIDDHDRAETAFKLLETQTERALQDGNLSRREARKVAYELEEAREEYCRVALGAAKKAGGKKNGKYLARGMKKSLDGQWEPEIQEEGEFDALEKNDREMQIKVAVDGHIKQLEDEGNERYSQLLRDLPEEAQDELLASVAEIDYQIQEGNKALLAFLNANPNEFCAIHSRIKELQAEKTRELANVRVALAESRVEKSNLRWQEAVEKLSDKVTIKNAGSLLSAGKEWVSSRVSARGKKMARSLKPVLEAIPKATDVGLDKVKTRIKILGRVSWEPVKEAVSSSRDTLGQVGKNMENRAARVEAKRERKMITRKGRYLKEKHARERLYQEAKLKLAAPFVKWKNVKEAKRATRGRGEAEKFTAKAGAREASDRKLAKDIAGVRDKFLREDLERRLGMVEEEIESLALPENWNGEDVRAECRKESKDAPVYLTYRCSFKDDENNDRELILTRTIVDEEREREEGEPLAQRKVYHQVKDLAEARRIIEEDLTRRKEDGFEVSFVDLPEDGEQAPPPDSPRPASSDAPTPRRASPATQPSREGEPPPLSPREVWQKELGRLNREQVQAGENENWNRYERLGTEIEKLEKRGFGVEEAQVESESGGADYLRGEMVRYAQLDSKAEEILERIGRPPTRKQKQEYNRVTRELSIIQELFWQRFGGGDDSLFHRAFGNAEDPRQKKEAENLTIGAMKHFGGDPRSEEDQRSYYDRIKKMLRNRKVKMTFDQFKDAFRNGGIPPEQKAGQVQETGRPPKAESTGEVNEKNTPPPTFSGRDRPPAFSSPADRRETPPTPGSESASDDTAESETGKLGRLQLARDQAQTELDQAQDTFNQTGTRHDRVEKAEKKLQEAQEVFETYGVEMARTTPPPPPETPAPEAKPEPPLHPEILGTVETGKTAGGAVEGDVRSELRQLREARDNATEELARLTRDWKSAPEDKKEIKFKLVKMAIGRAMEITDICSEFQLRQESQESVVEADSEPLTQKQSIEQAEQEITNMGNHLQQMQKYGRDEFIPEADRLVKEAEEGLSNLNFASEETLLRERVGRKLRWNMVEAVTEVRLVEAILQNAEPANIDAKERELKETQDALENARQGYEVWKQDGEAVESTMDAEQEQAISSEQLRKMVKVGAVENHDDNGYYTKETEGKEVMEIIRRSNADKAIGLTKRGYKIEGYTHVGLVPLGKFSSGNSAEQEIAKKYDPDDVAVCISYMNTGGDKSGRSGPMGAVVVMSSENASLFAKGVEDDPTSVYRLAQIVNGGPILTYDGSPIGIDSGERVQILANTKVGGDMAETITSEPFPQGYIPNPAEPAPPAPTRTPTTLESATEVVKAMREKLTEEKLEDLARNLEEANKEVGEIFARSKMLNENNQDREVEEKLFSDALSGQFEAINAEQGYKLADEEFKPGVPKTTPLSRTERLDILRRGTEARKLRLRILRLRSDVRRAEGNERAVSLQEELDEAMSKYEKFKKGESEKVGEPSPPIPETAETAPPAPAKPAPAGTTETVESALKIEPETPILPRDLRRGAQYYEVVALEGFRGQHYMLYWWDGNEMHSEMVKPDLSPMYPEEPTKMDASASTQEAARKAIDQHIESNNWPENEQIRAIPICKKGGESVVGSREASEKWVDVFDALFNISNLTEKLLELPSEKETDPERSRISRELEKARDGFVKAKQEYDKYRHGEVVQATTEKGVKDSEDLPKPEPVERIKDSQLAKMLGATRMEIEKKLEQENLTESERYKLTDEGIKLSQRLLQELDRLDLDNEGEASVVESPTEEVAREEATFPPEGEQEIGETGQLPEDFVEATDELTRLQEELQAATSDKEVKRISELFQEAQERNWPIIEEYLDLLKKQRRRWPLTRMKDIIDSLKSKLGKED